MIGVIIKVIILANMSLLDLRLLGNTLKEKSKKKEKKEMKKLKRI